MWICFRHLFFVDGLNCIAIQNVQAQKRFRTFQQLHYYLFLSLLTCQLTIFISNFLYAFTEALISQGDTLFCL